MTNLRSYTKISLFFVSLASPALSLAGSSFAQDESSALQEEIHWLQEETYVSTATKTLEDIKKSGASVSLITAADLKNTGARNLMDALKRVPGLGISQFNMGTSTLEVHCPRIIISLLTTSNRLK